jgi:hypothetical protein
MASVDLNYVGRHGSVLVPMPFGGETVVNWGDVLTTTEEHAAGLLQQPENWKLAPQKRAAKESD